MASSGLPIEFAYDFLLSRQDILEYCTLLLSAAEGAAEDGVLLPEVAALDAGLRHVPVAVLILLAEIAAVLAVGQDVDDKKSS